MSVGVAQVCESTEILYAEELEHVVHSGIDFHIRFRTVNTSREVSELSVFVESSREEEQVWIVRIDEGVVLRCEMPPKHVASEEFAPLEFTDERNTIQYFSVHIP